MIRERRAAAGFFLACALVVGGVFGAVWVGQQPATSVAARFWPFAVLGLSVGAIVLLISVARVHAFFALVLCAMAAGFMARPGTLPGEPATGHWVAAVEQTCLALGVMAGRISVIIALASVIGVCLLESGAAEKIVRRFLSLFGQRRAGLALMLGTYVVSIPIFFDTAFLLLVPLARALWLRTRRDYVLYVMGISVAASVTHVLVIPHPGPAAAADSLGVDAGLSILVGLVTGLGPLFCTWGFCHWLNRRKNVVPLEMPGVSAEDLQKLTETPEDRLPGLWASLLPIVLPLGLIWVASGVEMFGGVCPRWLGAWAGFWGNRNVALLVGTVAAVVVLMRQRGWGLLTVAERMVPAMETAGVIILITSAGGAFGAMLNHAGIGRAVEGLAAGGAVNLVWLAWLVAALIRVAQGSATTAIITAASIMVPLVKGGISVHPVYVMMAVGYGGVMASWMNDSGFWVISRVGGLTERETLSSWTVTSSVLSVSGAVVTYLLSVFFPMAGK